MTLLLLFENRIIKSRPRMDYYARNSKSWWCAFKHTICATTKSKLCCSLRCYCLHCCRIYKQALFDGTLSEPIFPFILNVYHIKRLINIIRSYGGTRMHKIKAMTWKVNENKTESVNIHKHFTTHKSYDRRTLNLWV